MLRMGEKDQGAHLGAIASGQREDFMTPAVCFDGAGRPHVACVWDEPERPVKYCAPDGGGWVTVDFGALGGASIAYDPVGDRLLLVFITEGGELKMWQRPVIRDGEWEGAG